MDPFSAPGMGLYLFLILVLMCHGPFYLPSRRPFVRVPPGFAPTLAFVGTTCAVCVPLLLFFV